MLTKIETNTIMLFEIYTLQKNIYFFLKRGKYMSIFITALHKNDNIHIESELGINNAGYYQITNVNSQTIRPNGRKDYQMIYIKSGKGFFRFDKEKIEVSAGNIVLYRPYCPQIYRFNSHDKPEVYWIHFDGTNAQELVDECGFDKNNVIPFYNILFPNTINKIISELRNDDIMCQYACVSAFLQLLIYIARNNEQQSCTPHNKSINKICEYISNNYYQQIPNQKYAAMCAMSTSYFLKQFKKEVGTTPHKYQIMKQLDNAKTLILTSDYTFEEISSIVGFSSPMYFSRIFKKETGMTPTEFKKANSFNNEEI